MELKQDWLTSWFSRIRSLTKSYTSHRTTQEVGVSFVVGAVQGHLIQVGYNLGESEEGRCWRWWEGMHIQNKLRVSSLSEDTVTGKVAMLRESDQGLCWYRLNGWGNDDEVGWSGRMFTGKLPFGFGYFLGGGWGVLWRGCIKLWPFEYHWWPGRHPLTIPAGLGNRTSPRRVRLAQGLGWITRW